MNLLQTIRSLAPLLASAAQAEYDAWEVDAGGLDPEIGEGGICDRVADAIGTVLAQHGIDVTEGGQDGDDHAFLYAYNDAEAVEVDIPPGVYETGSGYSWKKRPGVTIGADDVMINPVRREDILGESGKRLSETLRIRMEAVKIIDGRPSMDALRHRIDGSQLALDTDLIMEGAGNPLSTGRHTTDCGYYDLLPGGRQDGIRWMSIDRIFVHPEMRGSGGSTRMLADLCRAADAAGIGLLGAIAPDRTPGEAREAPRYMKVRNSLEQAMDRLGFKPLEAGGETYPLDRIRHPRQHESCTPIRFMQLLESAPA